MSPTDPFSWTAFVSVLAIPSIALAAVVVAAMQWYLARQKLKFDLFNLRMEVHQAAHAYLASINITGAVDEQARQAFLRGTWQAKWLYSDEFSDYLKTIHNKALDLDVLVKELAPLPVGAERKANAQEQSEIRKWVMRQHDVLDALSAPDLRLGHGSFDIGWLRRARQRRIVDNATAV